MQELELTIVNNKEIAKNTYRMDLFSKDNIGNIQCGQFLNLSINRPDLVLKRPFGICAFDNTEKNVSICYQIVGKGTNAMQGMASGEKLSATLPLGNGFLLNKEYKKVALIGGGAGVFPLLGTSLSYPDKIFYSYLGFKSSCNACLIKDFESFSETHIVTDDGTLGKCGNAVECFFNNLEKNKPDVILSCGPQIMLKALKAKLIENNINIPAYVSLEERMGCGIGACLVCACRVIKQDGTVINARVCKDGPVFNIMEVEL